MTRILSAFNFMKRVGFALLLLGATSGFAQAPNWVANEGQWDGDFSFKCEVGSTIYYVTPQGMTVDFREVTRHESPVSSANPWERGHEPEPVSVRGHVVQIHYGEASGEAMPRGAGRLSHYSNYFLSGDSTKWRSRVGHFENVIVPEVWPGIDVEYRTDKQGVETIYHVQSGADPAQIQMEYHGLDQPLRIDAHGNLILSTSLGDLKEQAPYSYQQQGRVQQKITSSVRLLGENRIGFNLGEYDHAKELVIDPLLYSTCWGNGHVCAVSSFAVDSEGNKVAAGSTDSQNFPVTPGAYWEEAPDQFFSGFVTKFTPEMDSLIFSTYFLVTSSSDLLVGNDNTIWWAHRTSGLDIPLTANAMDTIKEEGEIALGHLSEDGTTLYFCSWWGGSGAEYFGEFAEDENGLVYLTGQTESPDFYTTEDALSRSLPADRNVFVTIINPSNYTAEYSTFLPTSNPQPYAGADVIQLVEPGRFWLAGFSRGGLPVTPDAFQPEYTEVPPLNPPAGFFCLLDIIQHEIEYCSYWGTPTGGWFDLIDDFVPISEDRLLLCGSTIEPDYEFPAGGFQQHVSDSGYNCFLVDFQLPDQILAGTFLGGNGPTYSPLLERMSDSTIVLAVAGTYATDLPTTPDTFDSTHAGGEVIPTDCFVARFSSDLSSLLYGTYLGGWETERLYCCIRDEGTIWLTGWAESPDFPRTPDAIDPIFRTPQSGFITGFEFIPSSSKPLPNIAVPTQLHISAFPNPFNPTTTLSFDLPNPSDISVVIHDVLGRKVEQFDLGRLNAGTHILQVNGADWASGIYFTTLKTHLASKTVKMVLVR